MAQFRRLLLTALTAGDALSVTAGPWLALALRILLAQALLAFQVRTLMLGGGGRIGSLGWVGEVAHSAMHSGLGGAVQALCPLLLAAGLLTRPVAAAILLQAFVLPFPTALWAVLLGWLVVSGPGVLSLDWLLSPSARSSALPFLGGAARAFNWSSRVLASLYLLAVRVALAAVLASFSFGPRLPRVAASAVTAMQPIAHAAPGLLGPLVAVLLVVGVLVRPLSLLLAASGAFGMAAMTGNDALAWLLLSGVLLVHGAGRLSVDWTLAQRVRTAHPVPPPSGVPHVVVVGGGFGGITAVRALHGAACRITLIDRRNHHLFQPLLYQVATASLSPGDIATPIREMVRDQPNVRALLGEVSAIDPASKTLRVGASSMSYDYLVLATGARHSYFGHDEWSGQAPGLKSLEDATAIRGRLLLAFEQAESAEDEAERAAWLTFLIVGGGPTGVELAGAIAELARYGLTDEFRTIDPSRARVLLVQSGPRLLPAFPPELSADAEQALRRLGVDVRLNGRVQDVRADGVTIGGEMMATRTVFWAAGVTASAAALWLGAKADEAGRIVVADDLSVPGAPDVFAIGDTAFALAWRGKPVPGLAPAAKQGGAYVARVIRARLAGRAPAAAFRYRHLGSLATIGRQSAVADFGRVRLRGALAWWLWGAAHIAFLVGGRNRLLVLLQWLWAYLTFRRGTRLITGQP